MVFVPVRLHLTQFVVELHLTAWQAHGQGGIPEVVEDCSANVGSGKGLEGSLGLGVKEFGGPQQTQQTNLDQIFDRFGAAAAVVHRNGSDQSAVLVDPLVALEVSLALLGS